MVCSSPDSDLFKSGKSIGSRDGSMQFQSPLQCAWGCHAAEQHFAQRQSHEIIDIEWISRQTSGCYTRSTPQAIRADFGLHRLQGANHVLPFRRKHALVDRAPGFAVAFRPAQLLRRIGETGRWGKRGSQTTCERSRKQLLAPAVISLAGCCSGPWRAALLQLATDRRDGTQSLPSASRTAQNAQG